MEEKNKDNELELSQSDKTRRDFTLSGNMWKVIIQLCVPLAIFQEISYLFTVFDVVIASYIGADAVSAIAYLSQIQLTISAIGGGLAIGSGIKISEAYGSGEYEKVKSRISSLVFICFVLSALVLMLIPFTPLLLRITGTPEDFISLGSKYFAIMLVSTIFTFFNTVYIAIERARGNSKRIMYINILAIILKLSLTSVFVYGLNAGLTMIGVASAISQFALLCIAVKNLSDKNSVFGFSIKYISFKKSVINPMVKISIPVIAEKAAFSIGKAIINAMSKGYGAIVVGALGISNNLNGMAISVMIGFQDGGASIISQNLGAKNLNRALEAFKKILIINLVFSFIGMAILVGTIDMTSYIFASSADGFDAEFQQTIKEVFRYDVLGSCVPLAVHASVMSLFFGLGYTRLVLLTNFCRLFVFRIPVLWALQEFTDLGVKSVGIVMAVSNAAVGVFSAILCVFVVRHVRRNKSYLYQTL